MAHIEYSDPGLDGLQSSNTLAQGVLELDAVISETISEEVDLPEHPVEEGASITDHARPRPLSIRIEAVVSNTPIRIDPSPSVQFVPGTNPLQAVLADPPIIKRLGDTARTVLEQIRAKSYMVSLVLGAESTGLRRYENLQIHHLEFPRDAKTGDALKFSASFKEIVIVESQTVTVPKKYAKVARGKQVTKDVSGAESTQVESTLHSWSGGENGIYNSIGDWLRGKQ